MKIVVCGGGTVGHIAPVLAVVDALKAFEPKAEILYVGGGGEVETKLVKDYGLRYTKVSSGKYRRYGRGFWGELSDVKTHQKNAADALRFAKGLRQAKKILTSFQPDVVFCKGGYVTLPVGRVAGKRKLPLVLHESDAEFGLSNRMLAAKAQAIAVGFPLETYSGFEYIHKLVYTGNPVRSQVIGVSKAEAIKNLKISTNLPIVFVFGGSQGAGAINEAIFSDLAIIAKNFCIIHQTGSYDIERARFLHHNLEKELKNNYYPFDFLQNQMGSAFAAADIVVGRSSAGTISEIAANKKAALVIPNGNSANAHQQKNAEILTRLGAARVLPEPELTGLRLVSELDRMIHDKAAMRYLQTTIGSLYNPNSASEIAKCIIRAGRGEAL